MKIYLAGKISKYDDWRRDILGHRPCGLSESDWTLDWSRIDFQIFDRHECTGPFFVACDHGCGHGPRTHGVGMVGDRFDPHGFARSEENVDKLSDELGACLEATIPDGETPRRRQVVLACLAAVRRSDLVFVWLTSNDAHGTMVEVGAALASGVPVIVAWPEGFDPAEMWFALFAAVARLGECPGPRVALERAIELLEKRHVKLPAWLPVARAEGKSLTRMLVDERKPQSAPSPPRPRAESKGSTRTCALCRKTAWQDDWSTLDGKTMCDECHLMRLTSIVPVSP